MEKLIVKSYAKINLSLDVLGRRSDGYHLVSMVMQSVNLYDMLVFEKSDNLSINCNNRDIPLDENNLIMKAALILKDKYGGSGAEIFLNKKIPIAAGLGGGSSNAAATLYALNKLWKLNLNKKDLKEIALLLGADVPFFIEGGTKLSEGIGERLKDLKAPKMSVLIVNPAVNVSTAEVYKRYDDLNISNNNYTKKMIKAINSGNIYNIAEKLGNDLERVTINMYPIIEKMKTDMAELGAIGTLMSGSGSTVFGIFDEDKLLQNAEKEFNKRGFFAYIANTIDKGIEFI
ncbi:4-(cytidine 5'-diphospho)-2-C-methyl-D-erythritol kinase [Aceticella autotrophica]|uniref:4-diphosphocytidyl-2-C-methyl-D-erythritol kinase n=1 Tax=Aceticella autotrophica TaxID=2755338 RepID=A0A975AW44_9THEO|nr:4-(cytidine 5'-diphospho)-2-C-methyl-D-erythritol kinase [Aceticella autotrophica]QSZ27478.1 4-(cytidine 5'-diphospho)-2-C-methyl-D-erythritol kinase [Aceticella autotrophica]